MVCGAKGKMRREQEAKKEGVRRVDIEVRSQRNGLDVHKHFCGVAKHHEDGCGRKNGGVVAQVLRML